MSNPLSEQEIQVAFKELEQKMQKNLETTRHRLNSLRTGRASPSLLDSVRVESYGNLVGLNQVANISTPEARLLLVQVWDKGLVKAVEKAILEADLGLNPSCDGNLVRVPIPDLTEERRKELVKKAAEYCEDGKIAVRGSRRDAMDWLKKAEKNKQISENQVKILSERVQKVTDTFTKEIDTSYEAKSKDIMKI